MTLEIVDLLPDKNSESEFDNYNNLRGLRTVVAASLQAADSPPLLAKGVVEWMMPTLYWKGWRTIDDGDVVRGEAQSSITNVTNPSEFSRGRSVVF